MPTFSRRNLILLLVESDMDVARYLRTTLKSLFKEIEIATTLQEGEARIAANHIDAVLIDLNLTNGRGLVPVQTIRNTHPYLPIIVMMDGNTAADDAMNCGACDFLHKESMSPHQVFDAVVKSVARRETFRKMTGLNDATRTLDVAIEQGRKAQESRK